MWNHTEKEYRKNNLINMSNIKDNLLQLIGKTPLVRLSNIYKDEYGTEIIAKVEYFNPGGSVKDRAAYAMIEAAETSGKLKKDGTIIEPTSGNTGIGMAWIAALKGYKVILTMPETMSIERRKLLKAFGSELVLTPGSEGMKGAIAKAEELNSQIKGSVILQQFKNPANPDIHYMTTANEIIEDAGKFDVFISCVGTGGSITGIGKRLKEKSPEIEIIAVEPKGSPVLSGGVAGPHKIQGIGAGFIPEIIETSYIDKIIQINDNDAFKMMRDLARKEGLLVGISSGAAVSAAVKLASNDSYKGKRIIVLLPDTGERYLSMDIASIHDLEDY
jgi:cysteine synthase A